LNLLGISLLAIFGIFTLADWIIVQLFTDKYADVAHILKLLSPYVAVHILVVPLMGTFIIYEKQRYLLFLKSFLLAMTGFAYMVAIFTANIDYGFFLFSLSSVLVYGYAYFLMYKNYYNERIELNK